MTSILNKYSNLTQRLIAAIFGAIVMISGICYHEWAYFSVFFLISMLSLLEFYKLVGIDGLVPLKSFGTVLGLFIYTLSFLIEKGSLSTKYYFALFPAIACIYLITLYKKNAKKPFTNIAFTLLGVIYVAVPFSLLHVATFINGYYQYTTILGFLLILWASDTGAYFAGVKFGKRKLFERVSPKKSWEGSAGGAVLAAAMAFVLSYYFKDISLNRWLAFAGIIVVGGTYGDLIESMLKRSIDIKDSGSIIPGHGGFLDRFDGLLLAAPFIVCFLKLF